jgi:hypothetical protein
VEGIVLKRLKDNTFVIKTSSAFETAKLPSITDLTLKFIHEEDISETAVNCVSQIAKPNQLKKLSIHDKSIDLKSTSL